MLIMKIAHSFYRLNDIQINGSKSEWIIINRLKDPNECNIKVGLGAHEALVTAVDSKTLVRYLRVYLKELGNSKHVFDMIRTEIKDLVMIFSQSESPWHMLCMSIIRY